MQDQGLDSTTTEVMTTEERRQMVAEKEQPSNNKRRGSKLMATMWFVFGFFVAASIYGKLEEITMETVETNVSHNAKVIGIVTGAGIDWISATVDTLSSDNEVQPVKETK